ncbi:unnamed protein product [Macrosiphum euphorbiae]|nr:unnamed protein product [Macrosiphum euphorbiae]
MADEGQQHCGSGNISAVVWTTVFCTMLLVIAIVAIYFVYCKRREHDWSSLWWKSNSDKNLVLQTSAPVKNQKLKNGGTDNPAFSADTYIGDCVAKTGLTRVVRVSSSSIGEGSLGNELSLKEEDGRQIYMCKHNDGSKDQLVALRFVFDKGQQQQLSRPPASDLSRSLVELSRKYGLHVELETEGEAVVGTPEKCDDTSAKCTKSNILSAVRGQAQRLWHQRQLAFKGGDSNGRVDVDKEIVQGDVESCRVEAVHVGTAPPTQTSPSSVMTVNETGAAERPPRNLGGSLRYRTLEYGASPADAEAHSSPDSGVQCCTVNPSEPVPGKVDKDPAAAVTVTIDRDVVAAAEAGKGVVAVPSVKDVVVMVDKGEAVKADKYEAAKSDKMEADKDETIVVPDKNAAAVLKTVDDPKKSVVMVKPKNDEPKHSNPPPPPPPRKYSSAVVPPTVPVTAVVPPTVPATVVMPPTVPATVVMPPTVPATVVMPPTVPTTVVMPPTVPATVVVPPTVPANVVVPPTVPATAVTVPRATGATATCNASVPRVDNVPPEPCMAPVPVACAELTKAPAAAINEIRVDDDYYWCTTTAMAPPMSTFGKRPSVTPSVESGSGGGAADTTIGDRAAAFQGVFDKGAAVAPLMVDDSRDVVAGGTTSIEDASLPSFSSDEDEDDEDNCSNGVVLAVDKSKFPLCSSIGTSADGVGGVSGGGSDEIKINCNGETPKNNNNNNDDDEVDGSGVAPPASAEPKSPTKLPSLRLSLSSPLSSTANTSCYSSSASSTSSTSPSPTNSTINNSPIVSKIPVRRQSAGSGVVTVSTPLTNGTAKKSIPLPLSRSGSRLAMWTSAN